MMKIKGVHSKKAAGNQNTDSNLILPLNSFTLLLPSSLSRIDEYMTIVYGYLYINRKNYIELNSTS